MGKYIKHMSNKLIICIVLILVVACASCMPMKTTDFKVPASQFDDSFDHGYPSLSKILNKSGPHSYSYANVHEKRMAAIDELGNRYFYIYSPHGDLNKIIDEGNKTIWISNSS